MTPCCRCRRMCGRKSCTTRSCSPCSISALSTRSAVRCSATLCLFSSTTSAATKRLTPRTSHNCWLSTPKRRLRKTRWCRRPNDGRRMRRWRSPSPRTISPSPRSIGTLSPQASPVAPRRGLRLSSRQSPKKSTLTRLYWTSWRRHRCATNPRRTMPLP